MNAKKEKDAVVYLSTAIVLFVSTCLPLVIAGAAIVYFWGG